MAATPIIQSKVTTKAGLKMPRTKSEKSRLEAKTDGNTRLIHVSEYKEAARALAEAFVDDHTTRYFLDTSDRAHWTAAEKWKLHLNMMEYMTLAHCLKGLVVTTGPNYGCVALWMPPGRNMDDWLTLWRCGMWHLYYKLSKEGKARFFEEFLPLLNSTKRSVLGARDNDSYYLVYVGTRASARGNGFARKCIEYVTSRADVEGRPCYLESSDEVNLKIYGKMGFQPMMKIALRRAHEAVVLDIMVREPVRKVVDEKAEDVMIAATIEVSKIVTKDGTVVTAQAVVDQVEDVV